jgi:hypothetical protein
MQRPTYSRPVLPRGIPSRLNATTRSLVTQLKRWIDSSGWIDLTAQIDTQISYEFILKCPREWEGFRISDNVRPATGPSI